MLTNKQPTGGVILLNDTTPSEPKTLVERQIKKVVVQPAPSAGGSGGGAAAAAANVPQTPIQGGAGAAAAGSLAAMLTLSAVDEDAEDGGEAEVPGGFEYESEGEGEEE